MQRDMELVTKLLVELERRDRIIVTPSQLAIKGEDYDHKLIRGHLELMGDSGLAVCEGYPARYYRLTNDGHSFLKAIRDDTLLSRSKEGAKTVIANAFKIALEQGVAFALAYLRATMGLP